MDIFILEDSKERIALFKSKFEKHNLFIADNVDDAKKLLIDNNFKFRLYFLDHDLGQQVYVDSYYTNTGYRFAEFMALNIKRFINKPISIIVHSMNSVGANNIIKVFDFDSDYLDTVRWIPFNELLYSAIRYDGELL